MNVDAEYFAEVASIQEMTRIAEYILENRLPYLVLGGGSNILFTKDFKGVIIKVCNKGIEIHAETKDYVEVQADAGENWDDLVAHCVEAGYGGLENLSLIPGNVGASPVQNIGAYGVELKDHFVSLDFFDFDTKTIKTYFSKDCNFSYRNSIFKNELKGKGIVTKVKFRLAKNPEIKISYGSIKDELDSMGKKTSGIKVVREAVIRIRRSKLPDPVELGNAGSFFKNPVVDKNKYNELKRKLPELVAYPQEDGSWKLAAGWLIEHFGWKGYRHKNFGVHKNQALVLVNYGKASGRDIFNLSEEIKKSIQAETGVELEREVNIL